MNDEPLSFRDKCERKLAKQAIIAVKLAKLAIIKAALKLAGDVEPAINLTAEIPAQRQSSEGQRVLERCDIAFQAATAYQLTTDKILIKPSSNYGAPSEYIAVSSPLKPKLFLHRPAIDSEAEAAFPFWFAEETISYDLATGLPYMHYRQVVVDRLGNMQSLDRIDNDRTVIRPLNEYESAPYLQVLEKLLISPFAGMTEKAGSI